MSTAHSKPVWDSSPVTSVALEPLGASTRVDACVIGAGIAGLSVALCLLQEGLSVLVVEREGIGHGETFRTSAHLSSALDDRYRTLEKWFGEDGAKQAAESHGAAIDLIEKWSTEHGIECDFTHIDGYLFPAEQGDAGQLAAEHEAAQRAGLPTEWLEGGLEGLHSLGPAVRFPRQARFEPHAYVAGLARVVRQLGGRIVQGTVEAVDGGTIPVAKLEGGLTVEANSVVVASNVPFHERVAIHTKQAAYRTYMIAAPIPKGSVPDALIWDDGDPYHYVRLQPGAGDTDLLLVGGEDHKTGQPEPEVKPYAALHSWARAHFPSIGDVTYAWSGQVLEPVDGLGFIGRDPGGLDHVYVVTGDSGHGLTHGTLAGPLLAALIAGRSHPWETIYDPRRKHFSGATNWVSENLNVALQYGDWLAAGGASSVEEIGRGRGAIVRHGLHRLAVFRDESGCLFAHSAVCPHLGASVRWNARERSWDCPAHGSRFDPCDGRVLNGPTAAGLPGVALPSEPT